MHAKDIIKGQRQENNFVLRRQKEAHHALQCWQQASEAWLTARQASHNTKYIIAPEILQRERALKSEVDKAAERLAQTLYSVSL
jgi:hypothetical protein